MFAVVLAAGKASRYGRTKQLEVVDGTTLVARAMNVASEVCGPRTVLVTGHDSTAVMKAAGETVSFLVVNERFDDGIGSSIAAAARALGACTDALIVMLADQPLVTAEYIGSLIDRWSGDHDEIVATNFADTTGPPVLFPRGAIADLKNLSGDTGARELLQQDRYRIKTVRFADAAVDVDTPDDLARLQGL